MLIFMAKTSTDFETFWQHYPVKVGKVKAKQAWDKATPSLATVLEALTWQKTSRQWRAGYVPHPTTYINQGRYLDEPAEDLNQSARSLAECPTCGSSEGLCADVKVCNANWLARERSRVRAETA